MFVYAYTIVTIIIFTRIYYTSRTLSYFLISTNLFLLPLYTTLLPIGPWFVAAKDAGRNILYVTNNLTAIDKPRKEFRIHRMNWVSGHPPATLTPPTLSPTTLSHTHTLAADTATGKSTDIDSKSVSESDMPSNIGMILHLKLRHGTTFSRGIVKYESSIVNKVEEESVIGSEKGSERGGVDAVYSVILDERDKGIAPGQYAALYESEGGVCLGAGTIYDTSSD